MSKYNLQDILNEYVGGGRVGTINISYRDLQDAMDTIERQGDFVVRELSGPSGDGKVNREFEVVYIGNARRKGKEEGGFTVYDYKFGFDPGSEDHFDEEYDFSIGGNNKKIALILARDLLGPAVKGYFGDDQKIVNSYTPQMANDVIMSLDRNMDDEGEMTDYAADIEIDSIDEEEMSKSDKNKLKKVSSQLKKSVKAHDKQSKTIDSVINEADTSKLTDEEKRELKFHLDQFKKGNIDREDIMNVLDQFGLTEMMDKPDYNEEEEEIIKNIERMNPEVKKKFLRKLAAMGRGKLDEGDLFSSEFDRQELKAIINDLNKGLILDMPTRRAYKFLVSLLDNEDKEELGLNENGHVEEYTDEIAEADIDVDLVRATAAKANNQITNAAGMADFILDVIDQIGEKEQEGILNNINLKQAINFLQKAKESAGVKKVDESHAMGGVEAELEAGEIGNMDALAEEIGPTGIGISGDQLKDLIKLGAIAGVEVYVKDKDGKNVRTVEYTLTNTDFEKDPEMIDLDYIDENEGQEALKEHFNRFMFKKYS